MESVTGTTTATDAEEQEDDKQQIVGLAVGGGNRTDGPHEFML